MRNYKKVIIDTFDKINGFVRRITMPKAKKEIINTFYQNVKGKKADTGKSNPNHNGNKGHWLEDQMGSKRDANNDPDLYGYEMKTSKIAGKISFGDWMADEYIFPHGRPKKINDTNRAYSITKDDFLQIFGKSNPNKGGRYSWSGEPSPTYYKKINNFGQMLSIDNDNNIVILYSYSKDKRLNKSTIVPSIMQTDDLILAKWYYASMKEWVENKFNQKGWFSCKIDKEGYYRSIHFGAPLDFDKWIQLFKDGEALFDSGMKQNESRNYSMWRANNLTWDNLIIDSY